MPRPKFSKTHLKETREHAKQFGRKYGMAIIKWDNEHTYVSGDTKRELISFAKKSLLAGDYKAVRFVKIKRR